MPRATAGTSRRRHEESQPVYQDGALRFDGESSHLGLAGANTRLTDYTLFLVAAPLSNHGGFRAFLAMNRRGQVDFTSGVTVDMSFPFTARFDVLNVEGNGFVGAANLMTVPSDFGVVRRMTVTSMIRPGGTRLYVDGRPAGSRDRRELTLEVDQIVVGARYYGFPPAIRSFLDGDILQILVYDRVLDDPERREVEDYLAARLGGRGPIRRAGRPARRQAAGRRPGPAARADVRAGLLGARAAGRPDQHQQRQVSPRRQARRPGLQRGYLPAVRLATATAWRTRVERFWEKPGGASSRRSAWH